MTSRVYPPLQVMEYISEALCGKIIDEDDVFGGRRERDRGGLFGQKSEALNKAIELSREYLDLRCDHCFCHPDEGEPIYEAYLQEHQSYVELAASFDQEIACLERLRDVELMGEAYDAVVTEFDRNRSWPAFLTAAREAHRNFAEYRRIAKTTKAMITEVRSAAVKLATLINSLRNTGVPLPDVLMPAFKDDICEYMSGSKEIQELKIRRLVWMIQTNERSTTKTDVRNLLLKVSKACDEFEPDFLSPAVHAALSTRQHSRKSAFLRAFAALLRERNIKLTVAVRRAMAVTANVILNDADLDITEDDVRKAITPQQRHRTSRALRKTRRERTA